jgi:hypothetical protein
MTQNLAFLAPVYVDEEVHFMFYFKIEGRCEVEKLEKEKNRIYLKTTVLKVEKNILAIDGNAKIFFNFKQK